MCFKRIILCLIPVLVFTACGKNTPVNESKIPVINEQDYFYANIIQKEENQVRFKETILFSKAYPNTDIIDLTNLKKPHNNANLTHIDNNGNLYFVVERTETEDIGAIFSYNPFSKKWCTLVETDKNHNCTIICANEKYLLWKDDENANWLKSSLHLLDLHTMKDIKFYTHTVDPSTGLMYTWQFSTPVIIGDNIYFDDIVGIDKNNLYQIKMFSYSISQNNVKELDNNAKYPMEYKENIAWLKMSQDKENSIFFSSEQSKGLLKTENRLGTAFTAKNNLIVANDYMSQASYDSICNSSNTQTNFNDDINDQTVASYGMKLIVDEKIHPLLVVSKGFITNPVTNGDLVGWYGSSAGIPIIYSHKKDKLIEFDNLSSTSILGYSLFVSENYAVLGYATEDNKQYHFMWNLKA